MTMIVCSRYELTARESHIYGNAPVQGGESEAICQSTTTIDGESACLMLDLTVSSAKALDPFYIPSSVGDLSEVFVRFAFEYDVTPTTSDPNNPVIGAFGESGDPTGTTITWSHLLLSLVKNGSNTDLRMTFAGGETITYASLAAATKHVFQIRFKNVSQSGAYWTYVDVKLNGTSIAQHWSHQAGSISGATFVTNAYNWGTQTGATAYGTKIYITSLTINNTAGSVNNKWPGDSLTFYTLSPNGAGSNLAYTAWTNDYLNIDESPSASDFIASGTVTQKEGWTLSNATVSGTIRCAAHVYDWQTVRLSGSSNIGVKFLTWDGAEETTSEFTGEVINSSQFAYGLKGQNVVMETAPSGAAWTQTLFDNLEAGIHLTTVGAGSLAARCYAQRVYLVTGDEGASPESVTPPSIAFPVRPIRNLLVTR